MKKGILYLGMFLLLAVLVACNVPNSDPDPDPDPITPTEVSIIFNTGTDQVMIPTMKGLSGDPAIMPDVPQRSGYRFSHWNLNGAPYTFTTFPQSTIVLDAVWDQQYMIAFDTGNNGAGIDPIYLYEGDPIVLPDAPTKMGPDNKAYQFDGWLYEGMEMPFVEMPQMDLILVAKWKLGVAIMFETDSDTELDPLFEEPGKNIIAPQIIPEKDGYIFTGWSLDGKPYIFKKMPEMTMTLTAEWIPTSNPYNTESTLPKVFINLKDNKPLGDVIREEYVDASITISNTDEDYELVSLRAEFKGRGNGSWWDSGPKKGYRIKFDKKQSVFGEPESRHWVILAGANFNDVSLAKNKTAFDIAKYILDGIEYTTSTNWAEIYVNGQYQGVYIVAEHVRVGEGRVDIESEYGVLDTGYLVEYDAYATGVEGIDYFKIDDWRYPFTVKSPDPEDYLEEGITEAQFRQQIAYIKNFLQSVLPAGINKNFATFAAKADLDSFVDMYILHELYKNTDTGYSSFFMYKKPGESKVYAGPAWDFDATAGATRGDGSSTGLYVAENVLNHSEFTANYLFVNLMQTTEFSNLVKARWQEVSDDIRAYVLDQLSETFVSTNRFAMGRNFRYWHPNYTNSPNQNSGEENWATATRNLRGWLVNRINWLDANWS